MLQVAVADGGGSDYECAVGDSFGYGFILFCGAQHGCGADGGTSVIKCDIVGIHDPQMAESEIAHGPSGRADVEGIARVHQDDAQIVEFSGNGQASFILRQASPRGSGRFKITGSGPALIASLLP
jgi:hypothetical protein